MSELVLTGVDGANPLGFLAAVGTALTARHFCSEVAIFWRVEQGAWRPVLTGGNLVPERDTKVIQRWFTQKLKAVLLAGSSAHFEISTKLPFTTQDFLIALNNAQRDVTLDNRRMADFLVAFGSEAHQDEEVFEDTAFRMVRSGDSKQQGLPAYALAIRNCTDAKALRRTLFEQWLYQDVVLHDGKEKEFSLRWDPLEDQRYALRWHNPSGDKDKHAPKTMLGANALALEALVLFPTAPRPGGLTTTGFSRIDRKEFFTWPIWEQPVSPETLRSLLSLPEIHEEKPPRRTLSARGIVEIYRCERIAPNKYYKNFAPAVPI